MPLLIAIRNRLVGTLMVADEEGNVLLGDSTTVPAAGNPHYTISQRLAEMRERGSKVGCVGCKVLTWLANTIFRAPGDHCTHAMTDMPETIPTDG